MNNCYHTDY